MAAAAAAGVGLMGRPTQTSPLRRLRNDDFNEVSAIILSLLLLMPGHDRSNTRTVSLCNDRRDCCTQDARDAGRLHSYAPLCVVTLGGKKRENSLRLFRRQKRACLQKLIYLVVVVLQNTFFIFFHP